MENMYDFLLSSVQTSENEFLRDLRTHKELVGFYIALMITDLNKRKKEHDDSKGQEPEKSGFEKIFHLLKGLVYGSPEYKQNLKDNKPTIEHHQKGNRHHPEYFENGIEGMTLVDLIEMLADWKASTYRQAGGDIGKSLEINRERFKINPQLERILMNTIEQYLR